MTVNALDIVGVDLADPSTYETGVPYEEFSQLRRRAPVAWHPYKDGPGFLALTGYDEVQAVSRDSETWSSKINGIVFEPPTPEQRAAVELMMLTMDPPRHTEFRKLINKGFAPRQVARLNAHVADLARQIVDEVIEQGECDFANDVAGALPSYVIAEMLGIPVKDGRRLYDLVEIINNGNYDGDERFEQALTQMFEYAADLAAQKRAEPGDDIATSLLRAEVDGQRLNDIEFNMFVLLLINAGGETTRNLVAGGILALMEHPDQWQRLTANPSLMPSAIEEMLRYVSPVMNFVRTATRDTRLRGLPVKAGERAAMFYISANRDETRFGDPNQFDISRAPNPHLAFGGGGTHFCLGANLARVEAAAIIPEVLERMIGLELAGPVKRTWSNQMNGINSMPVRFMPAGRAAH
ncbi:cytochrome [Mycobacterium paraffinicum]|uniref:Cytochrome n=1 Tax=Mycobacterium paraffinicum TaxID=53378 RepID=A0A1Q4HRT6_9MYCO|nr:cytochrome P450 [Mycobacterium paraffinicum]OJZ71638.1 cytochrome [Mycobacterium paraffinicum]